MNWINGRKNKTRVLSKFIYVTFPLLKNIRYNDWRDSFHGDLRSAYCALTAYSVFCVLRNVRGHELLWPLILSLIHAVSYWVCLIKMKNSHDENTTEVIHIWSEIGCFWAAKVQVIRSGAQVIRSGADFNKLINCYVRLLIYTKRYEHINLTYCKDFQHKFLI